MKIDKTRFLLLTTTIAASAAAAMVVTSGCATTNTNTDGGTTTTDSGSDAATADSSTDSGDGGAACLDDNGSAPYCGPTGEGALDAGDPDAGDASTDAGVTAPVCPTECNNVLENFKKGVASAINDCLNKDKDENTCFPRIKTCLSGALANTCDDATAKTYCEALVTKCNGDAGTDAGSDDAGDAGTSTTVFNQQTCEKLVKGLNTKGRENFTFCVTEGGDTCLDPAFCLDTFSQ